MSLAKQNMVWNDEADKKLLLAFLKVSGVKANFEALANELCTDETTCTPRAVQEHLKKLRKIVQGEAGPATPSKSSTTNTTTMITPVKAPRKKAACAPNEVKKTRKPAAGGRGTKGKSVDVDDVEDVPTKMEPDSDNDHNGEPPSKKRKYGEITQGSGKAGGGKSAVGSKSANADQNDLDELLSA